MTNDKPTDNSEATLYRAATIKAEIKKLEEEYERLYPAAVARVLELKPEDRDKYTLAIGDIGFFRLEKFSRWTFSKEIEKLKKELDSKKAKEKKLGIATVERNYIIKFSDKKNEKN